MLQIGDNSKRIKKILLVSLLNEACLQCIIFRYFFVVNKTSLFLSLMKPSVPMNLIKFTFKF